MTDLYETSAEQRRAYRRAVDLELEAVALQSRLDRIHARRLDAVPAAPTGWADMPMPRRMPTLRGFA